MAERLSAASVVSASYAELRRGVEAVLIQGQRAIEEAKVQTYWDTGRIIAAHLRLHENEPSYGTQAMARLARDLKVSDSVLYRCVRFVDSFPILARGPKLSWAHYRILIPVADPAQRRSLERAALKHAWTAAQLDEQVRPLRATADNEGANEDRPARPAARLLTPKRGTPGLHLVVAHDDGLAVDLGFKLYRPIAAGGGDKGEIVRVAGERVAREATATKADLFTYAARIRRVVDGDTIVVVLRVGPGVELVEKLRLRGLDCPERDTAEGKAAKRFTESLLPPGREVTLSTTKPDKYDRYLADVFVSAGSGETLFLNNALLEHGHAVRKDAWQFGDWEKDLG